MSADYLNTALGDLARTIPGATAVFHANRLDFCCQGHRTLADAAAKKGISATDVIVQLEALKPGVSDARDWQQASSAELVEHILARFHMRHREQLPELMRLARRVEQVHGDRPDCPNGLADHLSCMAQEMESHMLKEEQILFPLLLQGQQAIAGGPISVMRYEHEQHGEALDEIIRLTDDITPPVGACNTWQALYRGLEEFRQDLMQHIHLENNILFASSPRATGYACCSKG
ncbi:iron-sulfur cluster repair protein YtfE [Halopseudomonas salina]|uniref:Iron-sulfur cluster repair protein YtfE n=1 Tax=Halopseudomonas salina TaxID=1323744 RepID=A0ABQ1PJ33_9GAMM|nr:iron-sulfur cluster repair protein YtfE [Halopseudomonas salina]GGC98079.1 iron-sulfur cluster repair protein YtfE [Halopseudomonas salina]